METAANRFGKMLMAKLRDGALEKFDNLMRGGNPGPMDRQLQEKLKNIDAETKELFRTVLMVALRNGMHDLLFTLHDGSIEETGRENETREGDGPGAIVVKIDGEDIRDGSDGLHYDLYAWENGFSQYTGTTAALMKYGTAGWPKAVVENEAHEICCVKRDR